MNLRQLTIVTTFAFMTLFSSISMADEAEKDYEGTLRKINIIVDDEAMEQEIEAPIHMDSDEYIEVEDGAIQKDLKLYVKFETNRGNFIAQLDANRAPNTVGNFVEYLNDEFYNGLIFHRVIDGFMVQGGGYDEVMEERAARIPVSIESKNGLKNVRGTLAMARTQDPNSATSQFFINTVDNEFLDYPAHDGYGYTVFGKVIDGMDVIDTMAKVKTESIDGYDDVPVETIIIEKAYLIDNPQ